LDTAPHGSVDALGSISQRTAAALFRDRLLLAGRDLAFTQDYVDCAELAMAAGLREQARHLYQLAFLRRGFAPAQLREQAEVARQTGLWGDAGLETATAATTDAPMARFSVDIALAELRGLRGRAGIADTVEETGSDTFGAAAFERLPLPVPPPITPQSADIHAMEACDALFRALRSEVGDGGEALAALLDQLRHAILDAPARDLAGDIVNIERLATRFVFDSIQHFLQANFQLAYAPYGSAALLHASARLSPAGLGAYLTNVRGIIRNSRDVFALVQLAAGRAAGEELDLAAVDRWSVLLATHLSGPALLDLIDDLGDVGLLRPLCGLLAGAIWRSGIRRDYDAVWRIRDAFLDLGDLELGASAQRVVALWAGNNRVEWTILGEIHATAGDVERAEAAFARALAIAPGDPGVVERVTAMRAGHFTPFAILGGFATPKPRQRARFARQAQRAAA
jgi:tetratricopeptide (TPR) repeat protein